MKNQLFRNVLLPLALTLTSLVVSAQNDTLSAAAGDRYLISAKAGGVNFVEGPVTVVRKGGTRRNLVKGDGLEIGDRVSTAANGKAEILLNPGSYLRLGGNSTFEFKTTSLDDLRLDLESGSAILEVFAAREFKVSVRTPKIKYVFLETGVYRIDVPTANEARLEVWRGFAVVGASEVPVKSGKIASTTGRANVSVAKFDRDEKDSLDVWSKARSKELSKLSARLRRDDLRTELMRTFLGRRWNMFNSFGLWVFDPVFSAYCFLPFGYGWNSPYGFGYGHNIGWYNMPPVVYIPPASGGSGSGGGSNLPPLTPIATAADRSPVPPFIRMGQSLDSVLQGGRPDRGGSNNDPGPSYSSPSSSSSSSSSDSSSSGSSSPPPSTG
ncbi:MAG: FecR domain-containing protein, partial [Acidobacteriota bacterium]